MERNVRRIDPNTKARLGGERMHTREVEIRSRLALASPGPWYHCPKRSWDTGGIYSTSEIDNPWGHEIFAVIEEYMHGTKEDGEFLAHAREDIPWLLAEIERLRKQQT